MKIDPIQQYRELRQALLDERANLTARLAEIDAALSDAGSPAPAAKPKSPATRQVRPSKDSRRRGRGRNSVTLKEAVVRALTGKSLTKSEILAAVKAQGFKFATKNPANSLGVVLYGKSPRFENDKGVFSLGGATKPKASAATAKTKSAPKKRARKMSEEGRARIVAAQKKRWAKAGKKNQK